MFFFDKNYYYYYYYYYYYKMKVSIVFCAKSISTYLPLFFYRDTTFGLFATTPVSGQ